MIQRSFRYLTRTLLLLLALVAIPAFMTACSLMKPSVHWSEADRSSAGLAPPAEAVSEAVVLVYAARTFGWRGNFAVHTWVSTKQAGADHWQVHEVMGWRRPIVRSGPDLPDRRWYGAEPRLLAELRGAEAEAAIPNILAAVQSYPYPDTYEAWPGPNSNTFVAWLIRETPQLEVVLPNIAIGKDYPAPGAFNRTPSNSGYQASLFGYAGVATSVQEGLEINLLGLNFGLDPWHLGVKLPGFGQLSFRSPWPAGHRDETSP